MNSYQGMKTADGRIVTRNGKVLDMDLVEKILERARWRMEWGVASEGANRLALAILLHEVPLPLALAAYQDFGKEVVATLDPGQFRLTDEEIMEWVGKKTFTEGGVWNEYMELHEVQPPKDIVQVVDDPDDRE